MSNLTRSVLGSEARIWFRSVIVNRVLDACEEAPALVRGEVDEIRVDTGSVSIWVSELASGEEYRRIKSSIICLALSPSGADSVSDLTGVPFPEDEVLRYE